MGSRKASDCVFLSGTLGTGSEAWTTSNKHDMDMARPEIQAQKNVKDYVRLWRLLTGMRSRATR